MANNNVLNCAIKSALLPCNFLIGSGAAKPSELIDEQNSLVSLVSISTNQALVESVVSQPKNVMLIVDVSGSMESVLPSVRNMILQVIANLNPFDQVALVTFDHSALLNFSFTHPNDPNIQLQVDAIRTRGSTDIHAGIALAIDHLIQEKNKGDYSLLLLLSDGQANHGITNANEMYNSLVEKMRISSDKVILNCFGFSNGHDAELLQYLTGVGNVSNGMYYSMITDSDITTALGDCLGRLKTIVASQVKIKCFAADVQGNKEQQYKMLFYTPPTLKELQVETAFTGNECQDFIVVCHSNSGTVPHQICVQIEYNDCLNKFDNRQVITFEHPMVAVFEHSKIDELVLKTHLLRIRISLLLQRVGDPAATSIIEELETADATVLSCISELQRVESDELTREEGILQALEGDIGEALETLYSKNRKAQSFRGRFLQYAQEHLFQRSASSASNARFTYVTKEQCAMRVRFLQSNNPETAGLDPEAVKSSVNIIDNESNKSVLELRKLADEDVCYVTLCNWRQCQLGIGLLVHPKTKRERVRKLMPRVDIAQDYCSAEAYNLGIRTMVQNNAEVSLDREASDDEAEDKKLHSVVTSSLRGRINAWLPLYVNSTNWKFAKSYAESAFSVIATQYNDLFKPEYALKVCAKLLIQNIVKFMLEDKHMSYRAIQMYCDIHCLFLQVAKDHVEIEGVASKHLEDFITNSKLRVRRFTPDIGDLLQYLVIVEKYTWQDLCQAYIQEMFRRNAYQMGNIVPPLHTFSNVEALIKFWNENTSAGKVTMFNLLFLNVIARPKGVKLAEIANMYEENWGKIQIEQLEKIKTGFDEIKDTKSIEFAMKRFGFSNITLEGIAELILWAFENKEDPVSKSIEYFAEIPMGAGKRVEYWKQQCELYKQCKKQDVLLAAEPIYVPPRNVKSKIKITGIAPALKRIREEEVEEPEKKRQKQVYSIKCNCSYCKSTLRLEEEAENWNPHRNPSICTTIERTVFVTGLPRSEQCNVFAEQKLKQVFGQYGNIEMIRVVFDTQTMKPKGYAFICFQKEAQRANCLKNYNQNAQLFQLKIDEKVFNLTVDIERGRLKDFIPVRFRPKDNAQVIASCKEEITASLKEKHKPAEK